MEINLVIGASENPDRFSAEAINALLLYDHEVVAIGLREGLYLGNQLL